MSKYVSHNYPFREEEVQEGRTAKPMRRVMVGHDAISNKNRVLRGEAAMKIDLGKSDHVSGKEYGEPLSDPIYV